MTKSFCDALSKLLLLAFLSSCGLLTLSFSSEGRGVLPAAFLLMAVTLVAQNLLRWNFTSIILFNKQRFWSGPACFLLLGFVLPMLGVLLFLRDARFLGSILSDTVLPLVFLTAGYLLRRFGIASIWRWVGLAVVINFLMAITQFFAVYGSFELPGLSDFVEYQNQLKASMNDIYDVRGRSSGSFVSPNDLGLFSACVTGYFLLSSRRDWTRLLLISMSVALLVFSNSRGSVVSISAAFIWYFLSRKPTSRVHGNGVSKARKVGAIASLGTVVILMALVVRYMNIDLSLHLERMRVIIDFLSGSISADENFGARADVWGEALLFYSDNLPGTLTAPQSVFGSAIDNQYVYTFLQGGPLLLVALLLALTAPFRWNEKSQEALVLKWFAIVVAVNGITMVSFQSPVIPLFWIAAGMMLERKVDRDISS